MCVLRHDCFVFMRAVVDTSEDEDPIENLIVRLPTISDSVTSVLAFLFP